MPLRRKRIFVKGQKHTYRKQEKIMCEHIKVIEADENNRRRKKKK